MSGRSSKRLTQKILNQILPELRESKFYKQDFFPVLSEALTQLSSRKIEKIICYGLGSFHDGTEVASRYQLALLLLIHDELVKIDAPIEDVIEIYDPSFEPQDLEALKAINQVKFHIIADNEHCARRIKSKNSNYTTLVYMPHLDKHFYNNLLGANWYKGCLERLVVLGNSFQAMIDYEPTSVCRSKFYYINLLVNNFKRVTTKGKVHQNIKRLNGCTEEKALVELMVESSDTNYWEIFNNFAFHFLNKSWLEDNETTIEQHRLVDWAKVVVTGSDNEWHDD